MGPSPSVVIPTASLPSSPSRFSAATAAEAAGMDVGASSLGSARMRYSQVVIATTIADYF